jgi:hypothetical protein
MRMRMPGARCALQWALWVRKDVSRLGVEFGSAACRSACFAAPLDVVSWRHRASRRRAFLCEPYGRWFVVCFARHRAAAMRCDCSDGEKRHDHYHDTPSAASPRGCTPRKQSRPHLHCVKRHCVGRLGGRGLRRAWTALLRCDLHMAPHVPKVLAGLPGHLLQLLTRSDGRSEQSSSAAPLTFILTWPWPRRTAQRMSKPWYILGDDGGAGDAHYERLTILS